jgi:O-methyltransferase involved in polyketide biosynthesis
VLKRSSGQPSRTAWAAAAHRAAHQVLEGGRIFADPLALRILGVGSDSIVRQSDLGLDPISLTG